MCWLSVPPMTVLAEETAGGQHGGRLVVVVAREDRDPAIAVGVNQVSFNFVAHLGGTDAPHGYPVVRVEGDDVALSRRGAPDLVEAAGQPHGPGIADRKGRWAAGAAPV